MSMDLLAGAITYGVTYLQGELDEPTRRSFLTTGGRSFVGPERLRRAQARSAANKMVSPTEAEPKEHAH